MSDQNTAQAQRYDHCVRLRDLATQQTLTVDDRRALDAIADLLHALLVQSDARGDSEGLALTVLRNIAHGAWNAGRDEAITVEEYARWTVDVIDGLHPRNASNSSQESPNT